MEQGSTGYRIQHHTGYKGTASFCYRDTASLLDTGRQVLLETGIHGHLDKEIQVLRDTVLDTDTQDSTRYKDKDIQEHCYIQGYGGCFCIQQYGVLLDTGLLGPIGNRDTDCDGLQLFSLCLGSKEPSVVGRWYIY